MINVTECMLHTTIAQPANLYLHNLFLKCIFTCFFFFLIWFSIRSQFIVIDSHSFVCLFLFWFRLIISAFLECTWFSSVMRLGKIITIQIYLIKYVSFDVCVCFVCECECYFRDNNRWKEKKNNKLQLLKWLHKLFLFQMTQISQTQKYISEITYKRGQHMKSVQK